jgi:hypothetical protein
VSFGTTLSGPEYTVACEKGSVTVIMDEVTVRQGEEKDGVVDKKSYESGSGVKQEIAAWAQALVDGKQDARQVPEEALVDLELLEAMIKSGEQGGQLQKLKYGQ